MPVKPDAADTLKTRPTLLSKVRRGEEDGWSRFYELYENFIYSAGRAAGLSHEESKDVVQEVMVSVRKYICNFVEDKTRGRFRTWLRTVVQSRIADQYRRKNRNPLQKTEPQPIQEDSATSATNRIPDLNEIDLDSLIDGKLEQAILEEGRRVAKEKVRVEDYQAYDLFQVHERNAREVAISLGIAPVTVRVRAFRVRRVVERELRRIAKMLEQPNRAARADERPVESKTIRYQRPEVKSVAGYGYIREIAKGGYGYVYLFKRTNVVRTEKEYVAGKFIYRHIFGPRENTASGAAYQRALEGLRNFCSLSGVSEYLLRVFDVQERHEEGYFSYMMELADDIESGFKIEPGVYKPRTLRNELDRAGETRRLPGLRCVEIAIMLARGLHVLHERGFTHRDVRPSNIIFVGDVPKLADIDLLAEHDPSLASYIPRDYAAPEGCHSTRADVFSFGKTLYEMCTGLAVKAYPSLPPDLRDWEDHRFILKINKVVARACAQNPRKRYATANALLNDLESI